MKSSCVGGGGAVGATVREKATVCDCPIWVTLGQRAVLSRERNKEHQYYPYQQQRSQTWAKSQSQQLFPALLLQNEIPRSNVGQVAHASPTPRVTSQKPDITRCTLEAACRLWLVCWSNNAANSHFCPDPFNRIVQYCAPVWCRSAHTRLIDPATNHALRIVTGCLFCRNVNWLD